MCDSVRLLFFFFFLRCLQPNGQGSQPFAPFVALLQHTGPRVWCAPFCGAGGLFSINYFFKKGPLCEAYPIVGYCGSFLNTTY